MDSDYNPNDSDSSEESEQGESEASQPEVDEPPPPQPRMDTVQIVPYTEDDQPKQPEFNPQPEVEKPL